MAAVSAGMIHTLQHSATESRVKIREENSDDDLLPEESHHSRDDSRSDGSPSSRNPESPKMDLDTTQSREVYMEKTEVLQTSLASEKSAFSSPFSMQNMLKMKMERDSVSPEVNSSPNGVFSTEKLLQNTPSFELSSPTVPLQGQGNLPDYGSDQYSPNYRNDSRSCPTSSPRYENEDSDNQGYSNTDSVREDINIGDEISCCSEDTVLSVGNEVPLPGYNQKSPESVVSNDNSVHKSNTSSPIQSLTSFKHIQTHLNAISQLSQNLNLNQPLLLRPNPIPPNPLLFLNQTHLLFGGNRLQNSLNPIEHLSNQKHSNTGREIHQNPLATSPTARMVVNPNFGHLNHTGVNSVSLTHNLRHYKQASHHDSQNSTPHMNFQSFKGLNRSFEEVTRRKSVSSLDMMNKEESRHREAILNHHTSLKFSIDNILKADFGRRITDPLNKRTKSNASLTKSRSNLISNQSAFSSTQESVPKISISKPSLQSRESAFSAKVSESTRTSLDNRIPDLEQKSGANVSQSGLSAVSEKNGAIDLSKNEEESSGSSKQDDSMVWPAWVYCTRYSDRPSSGPRTRRPKKPPGERSPAADEKRPRTAFSGPQLARLKHEFAENRYLTERRRQQLASELGLAEAQIKIWFQNKRAKIKKASGQRNPLALQLMAQGLYNHSTVPLTREEEELQELQARESRDKKMQAR